MFYSIFDLVQSHRISSAVAAQGEQGSQKGCEYDVERTPLDRKVRRDNFKVRHFGVLRTSLFCLGG